MKIIAHIPARAGSERVKKKNIRLLSNKPLIHFAISACKKSKLLDKFYVNTDDLEIANIAENEGANVYIRERSLGTSETTQDEFNYDFICNISYMDTLVLVNPVCPFTTAEDIDSVIKKHLETENDTTFSCNEIYMHAFHMDKPLNFSLDQPLPRTQDISPVAYSTWAICCWNVKSFKTHYEKFGYASIFGKYSMVNLGPQKAIKISTEEDFLFAQQIMKNNL
jgi:CMP-N,N'-diacetyllegionaminic acid synthase